MTDFGLGKIKIPDNFEVTLPSGRKTEFTRAKTQYIRYYQSVQKSDFANAPVAYQQEIEMLTKLRELAEKEKFRQEYKWIDERIETIKLKITQDKIENFASAYYRPFFSTPPEKQREEMLNPDNDLMQLLNSCKISETEFDPAAEVIFNAYKDKTTDLYHLSYLITKCRQEKEGPVSPLLAEGVAIIAQAGVECSRVPQFLDDNSTFDFQTGEVSLDFDVLHEISEYKDKGIDDNDVLQLQKFLRLGFADREKIKGFIFKFNEAGVTPEDTIKILDALKVQVANEKFDINDEAVDNIFNLKKILVSTRKNESEERKLKPSCNECDSYQIDEYTYAVRTPRSYEFHDIREETPEKIKKEYDEAIELIENSLLAKFAQKYKKRDGSFDSKYIRVISALRNAGVVYSSILPLTDLSITQDGKIHQSTLQGVKQLKEAKALSADIPEIIKKCPKNADGSLDLESLQTLSSLSEVGFDSKDVFKVLFEVKRFPELKDFFIDCGQIFDNKQKVFELLPFTKDKMGKVDENSVDTITALGFNIVENFPAVNEEKIFSDITSVMEKVKNPFTGQVGDDAAGICSILARNKFSIKSINIALDACMETNGVYNTRLSDILWKLSLEKANIYEITDVLAKCRKHDRTLMSDKVQIILQLFEQGYKKDDIIAFLNKED